MAFALGIQSDIAEIQSGERMGSGHIILPAQTFEDGLSVGKFAKMDTASVDNMDGSADPVIAGVVLRKIGSTLEEASTLDTDYNSYIEYATFGLMAVDAKAGESPTYGDSVYASNAGDANDGLATVTSTDVPTGSQYIRTITTNVWLIAVGSKESVLATSIQEMLPATAQITAIADPGDAGAIAVTRSGVCAITTAGAETRSVAVPASVGIKLSIICDTYVGDATITAASAINQAGNNTIVLGAAADMIVLESMTVGGSIVWRVTANDGAALSTV